MFPSVCSDLTLVSTTTTTTTGGSSFGEATLRDAGLCHAAVLWLVWGNFRSLISRKLTWQWKIHHLKCISYWTWVCFNVMLFFRSFISGRWVAVAAMGFIIISAPCFLFSFLHNILSKSMSPLPWPARKMSIWGEAIMIHDSGSEHTELGSPFQKYTARQKSLPR